MRALLEWDLDFGGSFIVIFSAIHGLKIAYIISALATILNLLRLPNQKSYLNKSFLGKYFNEKY